MKDKESKKSFYDLKIYNYIDYIFFITLIILSAFLFIFERRLGVIGIAVSIFIVVAYIYRKKIEKREWIHRLQTIEFDLGKMMKKSVINNPMPMCVLELDGEIFWSNNAFDRILGLENKSPISSNIEDYIEGFALKTILDESQVIIDEIKVGDSIFEIKYSFIKVEEDKYRAIIYWLDKTQYNNLLDLYNANREVVMIIEVDGYEDVLKSTPEENRSLVSIGIEKILSNLEMETKGLLKKMSNDKYVMFIKKDALDKLRCSKFSILDKARSINHGNTLPVTLSIGIGVDGDTIEETGEFASGAIDMVLGRGGDQVAVKDKEGFNFYGGKSKGFERKTKVKSRLIGLALRELINQSDEIIIMGHHYPDMDAIGAAVGIYDICKSYGKKSNIVLDEVNEAVEIFVERLKEEPYYDGLFISHEKAISKCDKDTLIVVLDTHRPSYTECKELLSISDRVVVIDHHRKGIEYIKDTVLLFHEIYVSSTCEMVTELIQYAEYDVKVNKLTAEGLLGGIYLDTKNFEFKTGVRTFEAASYLRNLGADTLSVKKFFNSYAEDFLVKAEIIQRTEIIDERICISYSREEIENINIVIAKAADELLNIKKIEASFVLGMKGDTVFVSARSLGDINVHLIMEKIGGGGHIDIAGAQIKDMSLSQAYNMVKNIIEGYLKEE